MKQYLVSLLLLLAGSTFAQSSFKYRLPQINNSCERGYDSLVRNVVSASYGDIGFTTEYKKYNVHNRVVSFSRYFKGVYSYGYTIYNQQSGGGFRDSIIELGSYERVTVSVYGSDSLCLSSLTYGRSSEDAPLKPWREITYSYETGSDIEIRNGRRWNIDEAGQKDSGTFFYLTKYKNGKLFSDSSWGRSGLNSYECTYNTYWGDTIINYSRDSSWDNYSKIRVDSSVKINSRIGDKQILFRTSASRFEVDVEGVLDYQQSRSIDTIFANGNSVTWQFNNVDGKYYPYVKSIRTERGNSIQSLGYKWQNGHWQLSVKGESLYIDGNRKCTGRVSTYRWAHGCWELQVQSTYYYNGLTAVRETGENTVCNIPNPFQATQSFSCEALVLDEQYTLQVFDLSGKKVVEKQFFVDQSIAELGMLPVGNMFYFVITDSKNEEILKQKIIIGN